MEKISQKYSEHIKDVNSNYITKDMIANEKITLDKIKDKIKRDKEFEELVDNKRDSKPIDEMKDELIIDYDIRQSMIRDRMSREKIAGYLKLPKISWNLTNLYEIPNIIDKGGQVVLSFILSNANFSIWDDILKERGSGATMAKGNFIVDEILDNKLSGHIVVISAYEKDFYPDGAPRLTIKNSYGTEDKDGYVFIYLKTF